MDQKDKIIKLWQDPNFQGSFTGAETFRQSLKTVGINISSTNLLKILKEIPSYFAQLKPRRRFKRRKFDLYGVGTFQMDIAVMPLFNGIRYFLLLIDIFSHRVWCLPLKKKTKEEVVESLTKILSSIDYKVNIVYSDTGLEFRHLGQFFENQKILHRFKYGDSKCSFAEKSIHTIKLRLFALMRSLKTENWPSFLEKVVQNYNKLKQKSLKNHSPDEFQSHVDDVLLPDVIKQPNFEIQIENQRKYEENPNLPQVGSYCFLAKNVTSRSFEKSYDLLKGQLFQIRRVLAGYEPRLYQLQNLKGVKFPGYYYSPQLIFQKFGPQKGNFFQVEKIKNKRKRKGVTEYLVSYKGYDKSFDTWVKDIDLFSD